MPRKRIAVDTIEPLLNEKRRERAVLLFQLQYVKKAIKELTQAQKALERKNRQAERLASGAVRLGRPPKATPAVEGNVVKRGPGRPRKYPLPEGPKRGPGRPRKDVGAADTAVKRGPGRPRKNPLPEEPKRGPGRPRKDGGAPDTAVKRGPGRPRKNPLPEGPKRGPGRPRKEVVAPATEPKPLGRGRERKAKA